MGQTKNAVGWPRLYTYAVMQMSRLLPTSAVFNSFLHLVSILTAIVIWEFCHSVRVRMSGIVKMAVHIVSFITIW